jgi:hypothetical protein
MGDAFGSTTTTLTENIYQKNPMVELEENVMINASSSQCCLVEMVSNLEPNQVILEEKKLLHFIRMKIKKKWISIPMKLLSINEDCLTVMNTWDIFKKMMLLFGKI